MENIQSLSCHCSGKSRLAVKIFGILALTVIILGALFKDTLNDIWGVASGNTLQVIGQGTVDIQPDMAKFDLVVNSVLVATPADAIAQTTTKIIHVKEIIRSLGVDEKDFQLTGYVLNPRYKTRESDESATDTRKTQSDIEKEQPVILGYDASQQLTVRVRGIDQDPEKIDRILAETTKIGVNQIGEAVFMASDLNAFKQEARLKAIRDLQDKAMAVADAAGVKIGGVSYWYEETISADEKSSVSYAASGGESTSKAITPVGVVAPDPGSLGTTIRITANYEVTRPSRWK